MYYRIRQVVPQMSCMGKKIIHILTGTSNWTNKREIMHVSRLERWYSVNKKVTEKFPDENKCMHVGMKHSKTS